MSTRGFIALENDNNTYTEVLTHFDGYPDHMLTNIIMLINRDSTDIVRTTLTSIPLWTCINHSQPDITNAIPDQEAPFGSAERCAWDAEHRGETFVAGYGSYYGNVDGTPRIVEGADNVLDTALFEDTIWNEFGYIIRTNGDVDTYANIYGKGWEHVGTTTPHNHADATEKQLQDIITDNNVPA